MFYCFKGDCKYKRFTKIPTLKGFFWIWSWIYQVRILVMFKSCNGFKNVYEYILSRSILENVTGYIIHIDEIQFASNQNGEYDYNKYYVYQKQHLRCPAEKLLLKDTENYPENIRYGVQFLLNYTL